MSIIARRAAIVGSAIGLMLPSMGAQSASSVSKSVGQKWIDGWNSSDPEVLVSAFTPDGIYEDVTFGSKRREAQSCATFTSSSTISVDGLYVKLIATHVAAGHGTIEWMFGGKDVGVFKTGKLVRGAGCERDRSPRQPYLSQPGLL